MISSVDKLDSSSCCMCPDANMEFAIVGGMHDPGSLGGVVLLYSDNEIRAR
jgi:hypothetical protein